MFQNVQDKLYKEIKDVMNGTDVLTYEKICDMQYLDMVIKETLRLCKYLIYLSCWSFKKLF